ncbi:MAG: succinate dehydrogenase cytochrome b subunit [Bacteroidia bacterium]
MAPTNNKLFYSISKKILMSLTGLFLVVYLVIHLFGNMMILGGRDLFNDYAATLSANPIIQAIEVILFAAFFLHIIDGIVLYFQNRKARGSEGYKKFKKPPSVAWASRRMPLSALVLLVFFILHVNTFFVQHKLIGGDMTLYDREVATFSELWLVLFYVVSMVFLGFHIYHGFSSAFRTIGLSNNKYIGWLKDFGLALAIIFTVGFSFLPLYVHFVLA